MKGLGRRLLGVAVGLATFIGLSPQQRAPSVAAVKSADAQRQMPKGAPQTAMQIRAMQGVTERTGDIVSWGGNGRIWNGKAKAARSGRARWNFRR